MGLAKTIVAFNDRAAKKRIDKIITMIMKHSLKNFISAKNECN